MHLVEISIFPLNHFFDLPTEIMNRADKNWAHFQKTEYNNLINVYWRLGLIFFIKKWDRFDQFQKLKNDFKSQNFAIFDKVVHNFGKSDEDMNQ